MGGEWEPVPLELPEALVGSVVLSASVVHSEGGGPVVAFHLEQDRREHLWVAEDDGIEWTRVQIDLERDRLRAVQLDQVNGYAFLTALRDGVGRDRWSGIVRWDQGDEVLTPWIGRTRTLEGLALVRGADAPMVFYAVGGRLVLLDHTNRERRVDLPWARLKTARLQGGRPVAVVRDAVGHLASVSMAPAGPIGDPEPAPEVVLLSEDTEARVAASAEGFVLAERRSPWFVGVVANGSVVARQGAVGGVAQAVANSGGAWAWDTAAGTQVVHGDAESISLDPSSADLWRPVGLDVQLGGAVVGQNVTTRLPPVRLTGGLVEPGERYGLRRGAGLHGAATFRRKRLRLGAHGTWIVAPTGLLFQDVHVDADSWRVGREWLNVLVDVDNRDQRLFSADGGTQTLVTREGAVSVTLPGGLLVGVAGGYHRGPQVGAATVDRVAVSAGNGTVQVLWTGIRGGWRLAREDLWLQRRALAPQIEVVGEAGVGPSQLRPDGEWLEGPAVSLSRRFAGLATVGVEGVLRAEKPGSIGLQGGLNAQGSFVTNGAQERDGVVWLRNQRTWGLQGRLGAVW